MEVTNTINLTMRLWPDVFKKASLMFIILLCWVSPPPQLKGVFYSIASKPLESRSLAIRSDKFCSAYQILSDNL